MVANLIKFFEYGEVTRFLGRKSVMQQEMLWGEGSNIIEKADFIAGRLSECVKCDGVFINLSNRKRLFSFGMSGAIAANFESRTHQIVDTVCSVTIARNMRLVVNDARRDDDLNAIAHVSSGNVAGYLGQPIRGSDTKPVGTICAISIAPRIWSELDKFNLQLSCMKAEYLLATELAKNQNTFLSQALGECDDVIAGLSKKLRLMSSVHGERGELLFATNTLLEEVDAMALENAFQNHLQTQNADGELSQWEDLEPGAASDMVARIECDGYGVWRARIQRCPGSVSIVSWTRDRDSLH